ncbi:MAG: LPS export ABC transporter ATP-binding protein [Pseudomonadota bacterium]
MSTLAPVVLNVENLAQRYGDRTILKNISLTVREGEVVGLLGPNGAGKTTCFYLIAGLLPVQVGEVSLQGKVITHWSIDARGDAGMAYLPQEASVFRDLTVEDNLKVVLELRKVPVKEHEEKMDTLLNELHIQGIRKQKGRSLSGGERRRVEIARALAMSPKIVLLDEPFAGVDPLAVQDIQNIIRYLKTRGLGVLITDHNVRETLGICDRASILYDGEVLAEGEPSHLVDHPSVRSVYLGENFSY